MMNKPQATPAAPDSKKAKLKANAKAKTGQVEGETNSCYIADTMWDKVHEWIVEKTGELILTTSKHDVQFGTSTPRSQVVIVRLCVNSVVSLK